MKPSRTSEGIRRSGVLSADNAGPLAKRGAAIAGGLGWVVLGIGGIVLAGWALELPLLRSLLPGQVDMKANAALGFVLSGLALVLRTRRPGFSAAGAAFSLLIGLATLAQYVGNQDWGIDELLFAEAVNALDTVHPGRMAPPTALNFTLLGTALLLHSRWVRWSAGLALTAMVVAGLAFVGNLYGVPWLVTFGPFTAMAAPTGIAFFLLGTGVLFAGGGGFMGRLHRSVLTVGFGAALSLLLVLGGAVVRNTQLLVENNHRVVHTHEVLNQLAGIRSSIQDVETGTRGYLLTGIPAFLDPYASATEAVRGLEPRLRSMIAGHPGQLDRLDRLNGLVESKLANAAEQVALYDRGAAGAAHALVASGEGKRLMDAIRQVLDEMQATEAARLRESLAGSMTSTTKTLITLGAGLMISVGLFVAVFIFLRREIRARARITAALRRSEESLAVTLHSIGDAVLATDTAGRVTLMNPVAEQLTGWSQAEARGRPVAEVFAIISEDTRQSARIPVDEVLATGETQDPANHTALIARDGTERAIADRAAPIRDTEGNILGVVLVFRDVTAAQAARKALRESETRYRSLFESIDQGFCILQLIFDGQDQPEDYRFLEINPAFEKQSGLKGAVGRRMKEIAPEIEQDWINVMGRVATTGEPMRLQNRAEALHRVFDVYAFRFGDPERRQVAVLFSDITERQRAQEELDRFFTLSLDFLCIASGDGTFKRASPGITEILGWTVEEFLARPYLEQVHPDDRAATRREVERQLVQGEKVFHFENRYQHKDGSWRVLSWRSTPHDGLMYATARDVTEARRAEEQIRTLNKVLSQHAAQLELANKELESFSYSVSHDLRAPLRHVQGYVEMLTREAGTGLSEKAQRYLKTIADAGREMGQLIDDLLAFSRMGRAEMRESEVALTILAEEVRATLGPAAPGRAIRWTIQPLPVVRGDPAMLRVVLTNLLGNAAKYTRPQVQAEIELGCAGPEGDRLVFYVRDNGAGFDMKYADKLFGVFQRLHRPDEFEGTGIGLASVRRIVGRHGGRVWAEAVVGAGATFYFTLQPAAMPAAPSP